MTSGAAAVATAGYGGLVTAARDTGVSRTVQWADSAGGSPSEEGHMSSAQAAHRPLRQCSKRGSGVNSTLYEGISSASSLRRNSTMPQGTTSQVSEP